MKITTKEMVMAALFTALMCTVTILVRVFQPVVVIPFSLQPLIMLIAACVLSPTAAFLSMLAYVVMGLIGLPVLSVPPYGGLAYFLMPSAGFLLAFPLSAWVQSRLIKRVNLLNFILAGCAGIIVLYLVGLPYMYIILNFYLGQAVNIMKVLQWGFFPFISFDLLKVVIAALLALELSRRLNVKREIKA